MELEAVLRGRRSIRAYRPEPVPEEDLHAILEQAFWSPSWRNIQPWKVWVVTGEALARFRAGVVAAVARRDTPQLDLAHSVTAQFPAACKARAEELFRARADALEAAGEPSDTGSGLARAAELFGAPCLLVFGFEDCLADPYAAYDTGALVQSVCLAAYDRGLGTCITATLVRYPAVLREVLPDISGVRFVVGVTLGYPEPDAAENTFPRTRAALDEIVTWVE